MSYVMTNVPPQSPSPPSRVPSPARRHAAPAGPWPWMDLDSDSEYEESPRTNIPLAPTEESPTQDYNLHGPPEAYNTYPQSLFPNWKPNQLKRSGITGALEGKPQGVCAIRVIDVSTEGVFSSGQPHTIPDDLSKKTEFWELMNKPRPEDLRLRALFVENLSGPVLRMLGARYNIEPFFFSSSLNWIPTRFQEDLQPGKSDHITITLLFMRSINAPKECTTLPSGRRRLSDLPPLRVENSIDPKAPLILRSVKKVLISDIMSVHLFRDNRNTTLVSYHAPSKWRTTSSRQLHGRTYHAGQSVYWQKIFRKSPDPTFVLLAMLWHALYAWDEALQTLFRHICWLEARVIHSDTDLTQELYIIRASLLHYSALLDDFRQSVQFLLNTPNPALESNLSCDQREETRNLMIKECNTLLSEVERLQTGRMMHDKRLGNVMNLAFATTNLSDSQRMQEMTVATVHDSSVMKQISYLTMIYLPASFAASAFGMNVSEIAEGSHAHLAVYVATAVLLTVITIVIIMLPNPRVGMQGKWWWPTSWVYRWRNKDRRDTQMGDATQMA